MTLKSESYFGGGDVLIDRLDADGLPTGYRLEASVDAFKLSPQFERKTQVSKGRGAKYGQEIAAVPLPKETGVSWILQKFSSLSLAQAVLGATTDGSQASGTLTDEPVTAKLGFYVDIGKYKLSGVTVTNEAGDTTYEEGTDYYLDEDYGLLCAISTGNITDAEVLHVSGEYAQFDYSDIIPGDGTQVLLRVRFLGENRVDGKLTEVLCLQVSTTPAGELNFQGEEFITLPQEGVCQLPDGASYAYKIRKQN